MLTSKTFRSLIGHYYIVQSILVPIVLSYTFPWDNFQETSRPTCEATECREMSEDLKQSMRNTVDPCDDFYEYVCGHWKKYSDLEPYLGYRDLESILEYNANKQVRNKLEEPMKSYEDGENIKAKQLYQHCMKLPYLERVSETVLRNYMKAHGFWVRNAKEEKHLKSWTTVHNYYLSISGGSAFFQIDLRMPQDGVVPYISIQRLLSPHGALYHTYEWSSEQRQAYFTFLEKVIKLVADEEVSKFSDTLEEDLHDIFNFRLSLQKIALAKIDPATSSRLKIKDLSYWYRGTKGCPESGLGKINWLELLHAYHPDDHYMSLTEETTIHVHNKDYLRELCHLLTHTRARTVVNHLHMYFMERHIVLKPDLKKLLYQSITQGLVSSGKIRYIPKQWFFCISNHNMHATLGTMYTRLHLKENMVEEAQYMIEHIKDVMKLQIENVKWLKEPAKKDTIARLDNIKFIIGFPNDKDPNLSRISKDVHQKMVDTSVRPYAFYDFKGNLIYISTAYFQQPLFDLNLPFTITYAALGTLIAHELYHMFDNHVVTTGALHEIWGRKAGKYYMDNEKCFVDYYSKQSIKELEAKIYNKPRVNGLLTREENIADVMGLKTSFNAYKKMVWDRKGICPTLRDFSNMTCDKLFFIAYARSFCADLPTELFIRRLGNSKHSPNRLRVNVPVSSMPEFARTFKCDKKSSMNPVEKCDLWE